MLIFRGPDGRTQEARESEVVRISILERLGWKRVLPERTADVTQPEEDEPSPKHKAKK